MFKFKKKAEVSVQEKAREALNFAVIEPPPAPKPEPPKHDNFSVERHIETSKEMVSILTNRLESLQIEMQVDSESTLNQIQELEREIELLKEGVTKRNYQRELQSENVSFLIKNYQRQVDFLEGKEEQPTPKARKRKPVEVAS